MGKKHKVMITLLVLYWPAIFILTHIPVPKHLISNLHTSDKTLHYGAYFILTFLLWLAVNPYDNVHWLKPRPWLTLAAIAIYGFLDEWLQGFVNRSPSFQDWLADIAGGLTALLALTFLPFWPTFLAVAAIGIFFMTTVSQIQFATTYPLLCIALRIVGYFFFTMIWIRYMQTLVTARSPQFGWFIGSITLPLLYLTGVEVFVHISEYSSGMLFIIISTLAILSAPVVYAGMGLIGSQGEN